MTTMINSMFNLVSYAQNFEDIILWRALGNIPHGRYIDIGAQSPDEHSVSKLFYLKGWRGVHVEPTQHYSDLLRSARPEEQVVQAAVTDVAGELRFFDISETGLSTLDDEIADRHREAGFQVAEVRVPAITIDEVFDLAGEGEVHWLKIDVEGAEYQVVAGWASPRRPWVLAIESTRPLSPEPSHYHWEPLVLEKGYVFAYFDGLNRFYVSAEHPELLSVITCGPNVFDDFVLAPQSSFCGAANAVAAERHAQMHADLSRVSDQAKQLQDEIEVRRATEASLHHDVEMLGEAVEAYKEDFERAIAQGFASAGEIARRDAELAHQQALMQEILNSKSWQITRPLRWMMGYGIRAVRQPKALAREAVVGTMRSLLARPRVGRSINRVVRMVPFVHKRLRLLASHRGIVVAHAEVILVGGVGQVQHFNEDHGSELLSVRARGFHARLHSSVQKEEG